MVLALAYWLHMAATVVWIGGLTFQTVILAPLAQASPDFLERVRRRFEPLAWLSLAVLIATGLTQMTANVNYTGLLSIRNRWATAILAKHLVIGLMLVLASVQTWWLQPRLARVSLEAARRGSDPQVAEALHRQQRRILQAQTLLSFVVLGLTAAARSA